MAESHAPVLLDGLGDPFLYRFMKGARPPGLRGLAATFRAVETGARAAPGARLMWAAFARAERCYVGLLEVTLHEGGRAELGYIIFSRFWRRGFGQEACRCILQHLVEAHAPRVITLDTSVENAAARRLAQCLGFREVSPTDVLHEGLGEGLRRHALDPHTQPPT